MKIKAFVRLGMIGLLTITCTYISPVIADNTNFTDTDAQVAMGDISNAVSSANENIGNDTNPSSSANDQAVPDTATGDDDY